MSFINQTPNYGLPQYIGSDKPSWLVDFNGAMSAIDTGIHAAKTQANTAENKADNNTAAITNTLKFTGSNTVSVTADGVKDMSTLLNELYVAFGNYLQSKPSDYRFKVTFISTPITTVMSIETDLKSSGNAVEAARLRGTSAYTLSLSGSPTFVGVDLSNNAVTDYSNNIPAIGSVISVVIDEFTINA